MIKRKSLMTSFTHHFHGSGKIHIAPLSDHVSASLFIERIGHISNGMSDMATVWIT